jgi:hypothetical protein
MRWAPYPLDSIPNAGGAGRIMVARQQKPWNVHLPHSGESFAEYQVTNFVVLEYIASDYNRVH